jgi:hypothetical protein
MSKPLPPNQTPVVLEPAEQVKKFADHYLARINPTTLTRLTARAADLALQFSDDELMVIAALDNPDKVQTFLNTQIYYNNDHASVELEETALPPRRVLQTGIAHCFEGALFAYAVNYLHGHAPRMVLLEASQDSEHNLVMFQNARTKMYGCNAHSRFPHLDGRRAEYPTIRALAESYYPYYYSDRSMNPADLTLVGYSEPFDLLPKFGVPWMASEEMLWDIYYTYIDDRIMFHYLFDDSEETHLYPLVRALRNMWLRVDARGKPYVASNQLPRAARRLWQAFWNLFRPDQRFPHDEARELEKQFFKLTGTTPIDLQDNAEELEYFLEKGYRIEQLLTRGLPRTRRAML